MSNVHKAAPRARSTALLVVTGAALAGGVAIALAGASRGQFEAWIAQDPASRIRIVMSAAALGIGGPLFGVAAYLWVLGGRIARERRYPPGGMRVLRDTPVLDGDAAIGRGRALRLFAIVIGAASTMLLFLLWRLMFLFEQAR